MERDPLPSSPAAERNKAPILAVLDRLLPSGARVLEIASGTGQHAAHCALARPDWVWQPTDGDRRLLETVARRCAGLPNVRPPVWLDVLAIPWPALPDAGHYDAVFCANLLHISPWATCAALMQGAADHLVNGGRLLLYGPYLIDGEPVVPSNQAFDADLRRRDAAWGLRRLAEVLDTAGRFGLVLRERVDMPANNLMLVLGRRAIAAS